MINLSLHTCCVSRRNWRCLLWRQSSHEAPPPLHDSPSGDRVWPAQGPSSVCAPRPFFDADLVSTYTKSDREDTCPTFPKEVMCICWDPNETLSFSFQGFRHFRCLQDLVSVGKYCAYLGREVGLFGTAAICREGVP
jgi:hypothetical protein